MSKFSFAMNLVMAASYDLSFVLEKWEPHILPVFSAVHVTYPTAPTTTEIKGTKLVCG